METQTQYREVVETAAATVFQSTSLGERAIFRKEGEYWTVGRGGNTFRLKNTKGLGYQAHLLRHSPPGFLVPRLAGGMAGRGGVEREVRGARRAPPRR